MKIPDGAAAVCAEESAILSLRMREGGALRWRRESEDRFEQRFATGHGREA